MWTREDDFRHGCYRLATYHRVKAAIDREQRMLAWHHRIVGPGNPTRGARELPYSVTNLLVDYVSVDSLLPTGPWRSVDHSWNAFVVETFIDQLAAVAGWDP